MNKIEVSLIKWILRISWQALGSRFFSGLVSITFCQLKFGALPLFSLSHSWSLRVFLEHSSFGARKEKKAKAKEGKKGSRKEE